MFGIGDSLFMQCGDTMGVGTRSMGIIGWSGATTDDLRARLSSTQSIWPWMTQPSHQAELDAFHDAGSLVIGLGTNDVVHLTAARYQANVEWFLTQAAGRPVLWFNIHRPGSALVPQFNAILTAEAARWPNLRILDWSGLTAAHPELLVDGIHLASYGGCEASRFALIHAALPRVDGVTDQPDSTDPAPAAPPSPNPVTAAFTAALGSATSALDCSHRDGGCVQNFAHGTIAWSPGTGVHVVPAPAAAVWAPFAEVGGAAYPIGDARCGLTGGGCSQLFQGGTTYWSPTTVATLVPAPILTDYVAAGGPSGPLGYPTAGMPCALPGIGCVQEFQHGSVYWGPASGAHYLVGAVRTKWLALGGVTSTLGYPLTDTACTTSACSQGFQHGAIYWSTRGTRVVTRTVHSKGPGGLVLREG